MMGELTAQMFVTLNGVVQAPGGPEEDRKGRAGAPTDSAPRACRQVSVAAVSARAYKLDRNCGHHYYFEC